MMKQVIPKKIGIIILAAGESARMGSAKQLLPYSGQPLLQPAIGVAEASLAGSVTVVLGANAYSNST